MTTRPLHTAIFVTQPSPTRAGQALEPLLDAGGEARLRRAMLEDLVERFSATSSPALVVQPGPTLADFESGFPGCSIEAHAGPDPVARLAAHLGLATRVEDSAVVVWADCPLIEPGLVERAREELAAGADLVLAPDTHGGVALIGARVPQPELFADLCATGGSCWESLLDRSLAAGLDVRLLPGRASLRCAADVLRLARALNTRQRAGRYVPPRTFAVLDELLAPLEV